MENTLASIRKLYPVSDSSIDLLTSHFTEHIFAPKTTIIRGGVYDRNIYLIDQGITRSYCLIDGNESTTWFSLEGEMAYGSLDYYHCEPGFEFVETLEKTRAYAIPIQTINELYRTNLELSNWGRIVQQEAFLRLQSLRIDRLNLSAMERYEKLLKEYPTICNRVNLGYIASYLGITLPTLSKLRARI